MECCPAPVRARMIGCYYLVRDLVVALGALVGAWLWKVSPQLNFTAAALLGLVGTVSYTVALKRRA